MNTPPNPDFHSLGSVFIAPTQHTDAASALAQAQHIYQASIQHLRAALQAFMAHVPMAQRVRACYPYVRIHTRSVAVTPSADRARAYGFVSGPGVFETTLTRPDLFGPYNLAQFRLLLASHQGDSAEPLVLEVGTSHQPIALHFALDEHTHIEGQLSPAERSRLRDVFDLPDLTAMDDSIANGTWQAAQGQAQPLSLFTAPRVDYSLQRLRHYTGCSPEAFQNFVLFTNYAFYVDEFVRLGQQAMQDPQSEFIAFVEPGNVVTLRQGLARDAAEATQMQRWVCATQGSAPARLPQMPAYHLVRADRSGTTLVNIGVGPANAKNITDHIAVLRPHAWLMLGHCAGLRSSQDLGDYVLAHAYVRDDHVLDDELPLWVPIPALAEIQLALEQAVRDVTGVQERSALKRVMRTGTVASTDNRNWELLPHAMVQSRFSQSRAVALDMESATIAANGFRFRVPYGTLLCVSDKPLHGEIKLPGMANQFYRDRVDQHLRIGLRTVELLRLQGIESLQSRKLRSFAEVAFQ
jgi:AMP nucleosidase